MPGITHREARLGKGKQRAKDKMDKLVRMVLKNPLEMEEDSSFALVTKVLGNGGLLIRLSDNTEVHAKVYSQVLRKARCWQMGTIVIASPGIRQGEYEIHAMVERADAKRSDLIPAWMIAMAEGASVEAAKEVAFEFEEDIADI